MKPSTMEEAVPFTRLRCAVHSSTALHSPSFSMRALLCHEVAEHCPVSPLLLYNKAVHIECGTTTLRSPVLPFQKSVYGLSETCVFFLLSLIYSQKGSSCKLLDANSLQAQHISDSPPFSHLQLPRAFTEEDG